MRLHAKVLALGLLLPVLARAQTTTPTPTAAQPPRAPCVDASAKPAADKPAARQSRLNGLVKDAERAVGFESNISATAEQNICPLSPSQKFNVWLYRSYSPMNLLAAAGDAAVWQATQPRSEGGYGQGWNAYGSRFGVSLADEESADFFQTFFFPALLHEDPRYFREAQGTTGHRFGYAISRVLVARTDSGHQRFNYSQVLGAFAAAGLANTYYPEVDRTAGRTMRSAGISLATSAGWNVLNEFGPDILRKLKGKEKK